MRRFLLPAAILAGAALIAGFAFTWESYTLFVLALVALTVIVGVGLNILLGLAGQVSLGHVGFYAIGAYVSGILILKGWDFFAALPVAVLVTGAIGALLALPALRVSGPYLAMVTIAFAFIVEHGLIEWKDVTGGANGLMGIMPPTLGGLIFAEREMALLSLALATLSLLGFWLLSQSRLGRAMRAVRDSEVAAQSIGLNPVGLKTLAFALSAALASLAGAVFAPLLMFISPGSFPFSQSILFLFAVVVGGAGTVLGPVIGALVVTGLPELLSGLAEYRLLLFGVMLLVVLWIAPEGIVGAIARPLRRLDPRPAKNGLSSRRRCRRFSAAPNSGAAGGEGPRHFIRRGAGGPRCLVQRPARRSHVGDRPERGRQDHRAQHDRRLLQARSRIDPPGGRPRSGGRARLQGLPGRHRPHLPDDAIVRHAVGAG